MPQEPVAEAELEARVAWLQSETELTVRHDVLCCAERAAAKQPL